MTLHQTKLKTNQAENKTMKDKKTLNKESLSVIKKKTTKPVSKKKQRSLAKSAKVMIEKMNNNTTDDDIMNIMMSMETQTDTKAVASGNESDEAEELKKQHGLTSLKSDNLKKDLLNDERTLQKQEQVKNDISEQLKLIDQFTL
ncbi:uncharacterized protein C5L36_0A06145 [Pichia kudriavzevii]|uniref:Uncharacterized protein n=2 Tax=Pichia kudriavzevii TaxID=4909 RepID=A0A2U9QYA8_PICKU|nr:uncharacterized protein C5L36_0A06145 [Pichia kudriavzevii]AWU74020.1 hypothetical protein C5L36_0A06145 [Pichia kudriavzevii]